ncbi:MAG TPA: 2-dehydropantoate 2-reductase [Stellaceae bacterium]|jgi:2-dehydropantoate 2-reductase|nr:2-dehydropantoate 2-reductase [Stellaceae bacterium]
MKITIFGAGAVGGHIAAKLGAGGPAAGLEVAAVARGAQLAAIAERGLTLWIGDERTDARIRVTDRPHELGPQDVVIITLKSSVLPEAAPQLEPLLGPDTAVVFAMNGIPWWYLYRLAENGLPRPDLSQLDPNGGLAKTIGFERVIGCMINSANEIVEPGVIRNSAGTLNRFTLGEPDGTVSTRLRTIAAALERGGVAAPVTDAIRVEIWDKLLRNLSTSPICALTGEPIGAIGRHPELFALSRALMEEGLVVARAHGIETTVDVERAYAQRHSTSHKSSMLQDFERGRPPEIDGLLTAVQQFARAAGVVTPQVDAVTALVIEKARRMGLYPPAVW